MLQETQVNVDAIKQWEITPEGYLQIDIPVARPGVLVYDRRRGDAFTAKEYRSADELFNQDSMNTLIGKPVTVSHPRSGLVTSKNYRAVAAGVVTAVMRQGDEFIARALIQDEKSIRLIQQDKRIQQDKSLRGASAGYQCDDKPKQTGRAPDGQEFDTVQKGINYNHLSIVRNPRVKTATFNLDGEPMELEDAIKNQYNKFFMSMTTSRDLSIQKAIADWTESQIDKMAVFIDDYSSPTWATDSITKYIHDKNMAGSFAVSTKREKNFLDAALAGRCLVMQPGSETWALKTLNAAQADDFTETDYQKIQALNGNTFEDYGSGITVTYPGTCGDGESIEVVRFCYWQADRMQKDLATLFVNRNKIGHDMPGYEVVCNKMESSLKAGQTAGGIIENFTDENGDLIRGFEVVRPTMAEVSATQRIKGDLTVKFKFYLRYAIKHVDAIGSAMTYGI